MLMRKVFTLLTMAFIGLNAFAQEEDVTQFITNPGFDEDLTWQADGSTKPIISTDEVLSGRSFAYVAEDNTVYCFANTTSSNGSWKRTDKDWAINGFIGQIEGWTLESNKSTSAPYKTSSPEWVYFGSVAYALGDNVVPIADDGTTYLFGPSTKPVDCDTEDNVGFAYLRAGWGGKAIYKQVVKLPCARYRLDYWIYNLNYEGSKNNTSAKNLCQVTCRKDVFVDEEGFNTQEWTKHSIEFTPTSDFTIQFGFESSGGSGSNPYVCIDGIKLYKIGEADEAELLQSDLMDMVDSLDYLMNNEFASYDGFTNELSDAILEYQGAADSGDLEEMRPAMESIKQYIANLNNTLANINTFKAYLDEAANLINKTESNPYPGIEAFISAYDAYSDYAENGFISEDDEIPAGDFILVQLDGLRQAINDYKFSQVASDDNPADYTFLLQNPEFLQAAAEPTYDEAGFATYPNVDNYTAGSAPEDATSEGWYIGADGGDQRLNYVQGRVCWNAWRSGATDPISISQDLEGLPNGYYSVGAYMITQAGYITDQHVFANGSIDNQKSRTLEKDTWADDNTGEWDWLETGKVLVNDGKLTIGGKGTLNGNAAAGWFCVTHFVLKYYGEAGDDAYQVIYNNTLQKCQELAAEMGFKADKAAFEEVINANKDAQDKDGYLAALAALNPAYDTASASQTEYNGEITGTYADLQDSIANVYPENCKEVAKVIVDLMTAFLASDEATSTEGAQKTPVLRYYRDNLIPVLQACETKAYTSETSQNIIADVIKEVSAALTALTEFPTTDELAAYVARLNEVMSVCDAQEEYETKGVHDGDDFTSAIKNPTIEASSNTAVPDGWTIEMSGSGNGYYTNYGQEYNGGNGHYLDAWNGTAALLLYNAYQVLDEIPNGEYRLTAMVRNSSNNGYYLYAEPNCEKEQIVLNPVATQTLNYTYYYDNDAKAEAGGDSISVVTDTHGAIWEAAVDKLAKVKGITGPVATDEGPYSMVEQIIDAYEGDETMVPEEYLDDYRTVAANSNQGRGWQFKSVDFEVTNHSAIIGVVTDSTFTAGLKDINGADCVPYDGTWMSADNFTLTILKVGDNTGWNPAVGIEAVKNEGVALINNRKYNLAGQVVGNNYKGIVIFNGKKYLQK